MVQREEKAKWIDLCLEAVGNEAAIDQSGRERDDDGWAGCEAESRAKRMLHNFHSFAQWSWSLHITSCCCSLAVGYFLPIS